MVSKDALITPLGHAELPNGWSWKRLDQIMGEVVDCPHSTPVLTEDGPFLARTQDVRTGTFDLENAAHVSAQTYAERIARAEPKAGDLLFSREGTYFGMCALVPEGIQVCLGQRMVLIRAKPTADSAYVKYWINSPTMAAYIAGQKDGSVAERINMPWIRALPIAVPPLPIQHQIAAILSAFDDKIELNRRMNRTLEQMARALFKSWFVDFDPVRAKMRGEQPGGMDAETAALFPDRLVEVEGREVPEGWEWKTLNHFYEQGIGGIWGEDSPASNDDEPVLCIRGIDAHALAEREIPSLPFRFVTAKAAKKRVLHGGEILLEGSGSFCGRSLLYTEEYTKYFKNDIIYSNFVKRLNPINTGEAQRAVIWQQLREAYNLHVMDNFRIGSAFPNFDTAGFLENFEVILPNARVASLFHDYFKQYTTLQLAGEAAKLAQLRDVLLPRLLAGEAEVGK